MRPRVEVLIDQASLARDHLERLVLPDIDAAISASKLSESRTLIRLLIGVRCLAKFDALVDSYVICTFAFQFCRI
jgi:hypothetical protein